MSLIATLPLGDGWSIRALPYRHRAALGELPRLLEVQFRKATSAWFYKCLPADCLMENEAPMLRLAGVEVQVRNKHTASTVAADK